MLAYRRARGHSQEAFAEVLGMHRTYVGGIERGERNLTLKAVERLADMLGVGPLELLYSPPDNSQRDGQPKAPPARNSSTP